MRIDLRYVSSFTYDGAVAQSHNTLRARPTDNTRQRVVSYRVDVDPPAPIRSTVDYWGTWVDSFAIVQEHTRLTVAAESIVETQPAQAPPPDARLPDDLLRYHEYLVPSPHVDWDEEILDFGRTATEGATGYVERIHAVVARIGEFMTYMPGATDVGTPVGDIFLHRSGVCQDYAHLSIAVLRGLGVPARYVSGYLYAVDSSVGDEPSNDEIEVSTHAWIEVPNGGSGWWGLDPTNQLPVGERHVKIGHGRDYEDVTPLRGVYHGSSTSAGLEATVAMSRTDLPQFELTPRPEPIAARASQQQQ